MLRRGSQSAFIRAAPAAKVLPPLIDFWTARHLTIQDRRVFLEQLKLLPVTRQEVTDAINQRPAIVIATWEVKWAPDAAFETITTDVWQRSFRAAGFTRNGEAANPPEKPLYLFRGCPPDGRFGFAWTENYDIAKVFAQRDGALRRHRGNVYGAWFQPQELLAHIHGQRDVQGPFDEWVIDPGQLDDDRLEIKYQFQADDPNSAVPDVQFSGVSPPAVIVDVDGTLVDAYGRPIPQGIEFCRRHHAAGRTVLIVTARPEFCRDLTTAWLNQYLPVPFVGPFHRRDNDPRPCDVVKREIWLLHLRQRYDIKAAIDDLAENLTLWHLIGIPEVEAVPGGLAASTQLETRLMRKWMDYPTQTGVRHYAVPDGDAVTNRTEQA